MSDQPTPKQVVAGQAEGLAEQAVSGLKVLTPADKGWVAGFIVVVFIIVAADALTGKWTSDGNVESNSRLTEYLIEVEQNRSEALERQAQFFSDQNRRSQEVIKALAEAVARDSERAGIAALTAIEKEADRLEPPPRPQPRPDQETLP